MSGDKIDVMGKSYYAAANTGGLNYNVPVLDILTGLLGSPGSSAAAKGFTAANLNAQPGIIEPVNRFLKNADRGTGTIPKAYINWILLDENFKYKDGGFSRVGNAGEVKSHYGDANMQNIPVKQNGYLYIYASNESPVAVFFDNLQVVHTRGPLLEETHYYPFGLTMTGISSKALKIGYAENKMKFNGVELSSRNFSDGSELALYETTYRSYDPQIGRFHQIDALSDLNVNLSTYAFAQNNPVLFRDPYGLDTIRGDLPKDYKPQPGDVWFNKKGQEAVYDATDGWVRSQTLRNVTVGQSRSLKNLQAYIFPVGLLDTYYCGYDDIFYDHKNYTTTIGKIRPLLTGKRMSRQAKMFSLRSNRIQNIGFGISLAANLLTAINVRDQILTGKVDLMDATGLTLGTVGITADILTYANIAPQTMSAISGVASRASFGLAAFQNSYMMFDIIYNNQGLNNWRPTTGNTQNDIVTQNEYDNGIYNWTDYFQR